MKLQKWKTKQIDFFKLSSILECGQCFRWQKIKENNYIGVIRNNVIEVIQEKGNISFIGCGEENIQELCTEYFDLKRDYQKIQEELKQLDNTLEASMQYGKGIRIVKQDKWECLISFIISANNNIPRIKGIIERLAKTYGKKMIYKGKEYYTFPTPEELNKASTEDLRKLGLGFRDKRVKETTLKIAKKEVDLQKLDNIEDSNKLKEELMQFPGVGEKVADCVLLFSYQRLEAFPIDVWVKRVMNELYLKIDETKVRKEEIRKIAQEKYGDLAGIAQQYLFYWKREA